jgi:arylsulfatase A-like enzyme
MSWLDRDTVLADAPNDSNTQASRRLRYDEYILQIRCVIAKLRVLFDAMVAQQNLDDAIIVIHGDHGSRIVINEPLNSNRNKLTRQDFLDGFSTLFAVRSPEVAPGYDAQMAGLPRLLRETVVDPLESRPQGPDETVFVYLRENIEDEVLSRVAMPRIPSRLP